MTGRARRSALPSLAFALVASASAVATAAEITGQSGVLTLVYDEALWSAERDAEGEPGLACTSNGCGGNSAACGAVTVRPGTTLSEESFLGPFRQNLARAMLDSARTNADNADPEMVASPSVATFGGKTGVSLSMRIAFDGTPTRIDYFWLQAGPDLVGVTCLVAEADYDAARGAFETIFADLAVSPP